MLVCVIHELMRIRNVMEHPRTAKPETEWV